jgi:hypothetical protein
MGKGVISRGVTAPMIKEGDDLVKIVVDAILQETEVREGRGGYYDLHDKDVIGITESVIARSAGQYVTVDDIATWVIKRFGPAAEIIIDSPIYSRNRFSMILKGIARAAKKLYFVMPPVDEVGNPSGVNPFTGVNIQEYYKSICEGENCEAVFGDYLHTATASITDKEINNWPYIYCGLHDYAKWKEQFGNATHITLADICSDVSPDWGLLGTNKSTEERLKLFPSKEVAQKVVDEVKAQLKKITGKDVIVCSYGDGAFCDPVGHIWEWADPTTMPAYTDKELIESTPNEIKLKAYIDEGKTQEEIDQIIKEKQDLVGSMSSQGTTPRIIRDLLASLMDLTSGSGDRGTPIVLVKNYFRNV